MPNFSDGSSSVVGQAVDDHSRAADAVSLVPNFDVIDAVELPRAPLNRFGDGVLGHVGIGRFIHRQAQPGIDAHV